MQKIIAHDIFDEIIKKSKPIDWLLLHNSGVADLRKMAKSRNKVSAECARFRLDNIEMLGHHYVSLSVQVIKEAIYGNGNEILNYCGMSFIYSRGELLYYTRPEFMSFMSEFTLKVELPKNILDSPKYLNYVYDRVFKRDAVPPHLRELAVNFKG